MLAGPPAAPALAAHDVPVHFENAVANSAAAVA